MGHHVYRPTTAISIKHKVDTVTDVVHRKTEKVITINHWSLLFYWEYPTKQKHRKDVSEIHQTKTTPRKALEFEIKNVLNRLNQARSGPLFFEGMGPTEFFNIFWGKEEICVAAAPTLCVATCLVPKERPITTAADKYKYAA